MNPGEIDPEFYNPGYWSLAGWNERSARDRHVPNMTGVALSGHRKCLKHASANIDIVRVLCFSSSLTLVRQR